MYSILSGIMFIIIGIALIYHFYKNPVEDNYNASNTKGIVAGAFSIIIGIMLLMGKVHW